MEAKFYCLSNLRKHALAIIEETEKSLVVQKLTSVEVLNEFSNNTETLIVFDSEYSPTTESKKHLSKVFNDVELTKDYWKVYEYLTGRKRKAVAESTES